MRKILFCLLIMFVCADLFAQQSVVAVAPFDAIFGITAAESVQSIVERGSLFFGWGDYDTAIADFTEATMLAPDYVVAYHDCGVTYYNKGDFNEIYSAIVP
jgi:lipoprotein NlpI